MENIILKVTGMSCAHCERAVTNALEDIGVASVTASAKDNEVVVSFDPDKVSAEDIKNEIVEAGYVVDRSDYNVR